MTNNRKNIVTFFMIEVVRYIIKQRCCCECPMKARPKVFSNEVMKYLYIYIFIYIYICWYICFCRFVFLSIWQQNLRGEKEQFEVLLIMKFIEKTESKCAIGNFAFTIFCTKNLRFYGLSNLF